MSAEDREKVHSREWESGRDSPLADAAGLSHQEHDKWRRRAKAFEDVVMPIAKALGDATTPLNGAELERRVRSVHAADSTSPPRPRSPEPGSLPRASACAASPSTPCAPSSACLLPRLPVALSRLRRKSTAEAFPHSPASCSVPCRARGLRAPAPSLHPRLAPVGPPRKDSSAPPGAPGPSRDPASSARHHPPSAPAVRWALQAGVMLRFLYEGKLGEVLAPPSTTEETSFLCAAEGKCDCMKQLLEKGLDPGTANAAGNTLLHVAAAAGHLDLCQLLLDWGVAVDAWGRHATTPLLLATRRGHDDVAMLLLAYDANPALAATDGDSALSAASARGNAALVQKMIAKGVPLSLPSPVDGSTPLHAAARSGCVNVVRLLLGEGLAPPVSRPWAVRFPHSVTLCAPICRRWR